MAKIVHTMIRVLDEGRSCAFHRSAFARATVGRFAFDGFTLVVGFLRETFARFFFVQDPDGDQIEVIQRSGRFT